MKLAWYTDTEKHLAQTGQEPNHITMPVETGLATSNILFSISGGLVPATATRLPLSCHQITFRYCSLWQISKLLTSSRHILYARGMQWSTRLPHGILHSCLLSRVFSLLILALLSPSPTHSTAHLTKKGCKMNGLTDCHLHSLNANEI